MPSELAAVPPGWYPAPQGGQRYWDGQSWLALPEPDDATPFPGEDTSPAGKGAADRKKIVIAGAAALIVIVAAAIGALMWKNSHDTQMRNDAIAASSSRAAADKSAADAAAAELVRRDNETKRAERTAAVTELESSVEALAQEHVDGGLFDGPVLSVTCDPVGGGSTDDLTAQTTIFECFAATTDNGDGTLRGRKYHATMNWDTGKYTYGLGAP